MRIINIDVKQQDIAMKCLTFEQFILDVVRHLEVQMLEPREMLIHNPNIIKSPIRFFEEPRYENVANLLHTIPIYLREKKTNDKEPDKLGAYFYEIDAYNHSISPYIELYVTSIYDDAKEEKYHWNGDTFIWLFTLTLLHELAHAAMDIHNCAKFYDKEDKSFNWGTKPVDMRKVREESMADAIALRIIADYDSNHIDNDEGFYDYCIKYCKQQSWEYAIGVSLVDFAPKDFADYIDAKVKGMSTAKEDKWKKWLKKKVKSCISSEYSNVIKEFDNNFK